jgi:glyoxylase-like metal-dependent hydrolase (beta-lactamase superfamily II)
MRSLAMLADSFADDTTVLPGHMGITTLGHERATNPFLQDLPSVS